MKIKEKIISRQDKINNPLPVIAFIGDSVTQGCFECFVDKNGQIDTVFRPWLAYSRLVQDKLLSAFDRAMPVVINAGISGDTARGIYERLDRDVLSFNPDLTVVSCGLNDSISGDEKEYGENLNKIFSSLTDSGSEVIFLTENMMCTSVSSSISDDILKSAAKRSARIQNDGTLDRFFDVAISVAKECGVKVCDCYSIWKKMAKDGVDINSLLINGINHPTPKMHELFADELVKIILE